MGNKKAAAKTTSGSAGSDLKQTFDVYTAKQQFFASAISMSWQLALTIVIPVVAGVKLDEYLDSSPSLTLAGFFLAIGMGSMVVWNTVKGVNKLQEEEDNRRFKRLRKLKRRRRASK